MVEQKIVPHLWFDTNAEEAVAFYTSLFRGSRVGTVTRYGTEGYDVHKMPAGTVMTIEFELAGQKFMALNGGPIFKFNPSVSFILNFDPSKDQDARNRLDELWEGLSSGGAVLMPLDKYPFSERYGWARDKFGLSWQLILSNPEGDERPFIMPALTFTGAVAGKAEVASDFYLSIFKNSRRGVIVRYPSDMPARDGGEPEKEGTIMFSDFLLENQWFAAMDSSYEHNFGFNESVSFMVLCEDQPEIDYFWEKLGEGGDPAAQVCGWLKDKYGLSWQIVPAILGQLIADSDPEKSGRLMSAVLQMKKLDIEALKKAHGGV